MGEGRDRGREGGIVVERRKGGREGKEREEGGGMEGEG